MISARSARVCGLALCLLGGGMPLFDHLRVAGPTKASASLQTWFQYGIYDPGSRISRNQIFSISHVFLYWQDINTTALDRSIATADRNGRDLLVTVEPYTLASDWRSGSGQLLSDITAGRFDTQIANVCAALSKAKHRIYVRWAHEMEGTEGRYPWAGKKPQNYIDAYRHFVTRCRVFLPAAKYVWSPRGASNFEAYYPGSDYVDVVGFAIWGLQRWEIKRTGRARTYLETLALTYQKMSGFGKPMMVAEAGAAGDQAYKSAWLSAMFQGQTYANDFPNLFAVVYFNDKEPYHWPGGYGSPDWRMDEADIPQQ